MYTTAASYINCQKIDATHTILSNKLVSKFQKLTKKRSHYLMGVSPLALAACGGGGDSYVAQTLVSGTDGNDTLPNSAANEKFEGGLGDDTYTVDLSGIDSVVDAGGDDTIKFIWRDEQSNLQIKNLHTVGNDLVVEMIGSSNIMTIKGAFAEETRIENVIYYHAAGDWGDGFNAQLFKFGEAVTGVGGHLVVGTNGNDTVTLTEGDISDASLWGANGDDNITTGDGSQYIWGGNGNDIIESGAGHDTIFGGDGNDTIYAGYGNDTVYGGAGDDLIVASPDADFEDGGEGNDTLMGLGTGLLVDVTYNLMDGTSGVTGGTLETAFANIENIKIGYLWTTGEYVGSTSNWTLIGTDGVNNLESSEGNDILEGRGGSDILTGNGGADTFIFRDGEQGTDTITDFDLSEGDKLDLTSYGITTEEAAEALMTDSAGGVNVTIDGSLIVTMTGTTVADFTAADGWLA
jgi:Ca2+-binding RTX toxin-like protein